MSKTNSTTVVTDASAPGSLPFVDIRPSDFGDLVSVTRQVATECGWIVATPAGPMVLGYKQARSILRDPNWYSVLAGISMLDHMDSISTYLENLLARARVSIPEAPTNLKIRPNVLSVEGEDHRRLRRLVNR